MGRKMVQKYKGANSLKFKSYENKTQNPVAKDHHIHIIELLYLCTWGQSWSTVDKPAATEQN